MTTASEYYEVYKKLGRFAEVARHFNVDPSTVRRAILRLEQKSAADPALAAAMSSIGMEAVPSGAWIKTTKPDADGRTYSFYVKGEQLAGADTVAEIEARFRDIPAVSLPASFTPADVPGLRGFLPLNDLHAGAYAWGAETGYQDWDLSTAIERLQRWVGTLIDRMPVVDECILFYNGDTLHANDGKGMTPESGHILDTDTRHAKVVEATTAAIIATIDMAAQKHRTVRVVIKKGNHDKDAYLALLMGVRWRYHGSPNVTVELDPSPYWAYSFGKVFLFGHHGDRVKAEQLVMKMAADNREAWGASRYSYIWTAHLHNREVVQHYGTIVERASCLTEPDAHGAKWGSNAQALAVIYHPERGEIERFTVRA